MTRRVYLILSRCRRPRAGDLSAVFVWGRALPRKEAARLSLHQDASLAPHSTAALSFLRLCLPQRPSSPIPPGGGNPPGAPPVADPKSSPPTRANRNRVGTLPIPATGIGTAHRPLPPRCSSSPSSSLRGSRRLRSLRGPNPAGPEPSGQRGRSHACLGACSRCAFYGHPTRPRGRCTARAEATFCCHTLFYFILFVFVTYYYYLLYLI